MKQFIRALAVLAVAAGLAPASLTAQQQERSRIPEKYRWNLSEIYPTIRLAGREGQAGRRDPERPPVQGKLGIVSAAARRCAGAWQPHLEDFSRLYVYASMMSDQDTRVSTYQGMQQEIAQIGANIGAELAFVEPEILKIDRGDDRQVHRVGNRG